MIRKVIFYRTLAGRCPVQEFLDSLTGKAAQKIIWVLRLLEDIETVPSTYFRKLTGTDIWECRIQHGQNSYRIFCFFDSHSVIVLTHGIMKKTQKTPKQEMERAEFYRKEFLSRREKK